MGNSNRKTYKSAPTISSQTYFSQFSLTNFTLDLSGRSAQSATSHQSTYSVSRPWSRVSRRRWHPSTLSNPLLASKTAWPVPYIEAAFVPEFKIKADISEKDFEVISVTSRGAFGQVFRVVKKGTGEEYALKVLSKSQLISQNAVEQVKDEVRIQSMCGHHPFIVNCPYFWQSRKQLFIVSEYMPGGELLHLCHKYGPLPEELVQIYVAEVALALDFLHNAGVIYRDLKLENILLDVEGHIQLIDFGLAKWLKYGCRTSTLCGTFQYMAPEVLSLQPYGHVADWWSLGVVTCCLLSGEFPTACARPGQEYAAADVPGSLPADFNFSVRARDLLTRLLCVEQRLRLHSLKALQGVAFMMGFNFSDVRAKKFSPRLILRSHFPHGPPADDDNATFKDFDS